MDSVCSDWALPHSEIAGSILVSRSPTLIAGNRVLHRLFAPRHPPYALRSLTKKLNFAEKQRAEKQRATWLSALDS